MMFYLLFVSTFFIIYGSVHWIAFRWLQTAKVVSRKMELMVFVWMFLMVLGPVFIPNSGFIPWPMVKRGIAFGIYAWMAFLFLYFSWTLVLTGLKHLVNGVSWVFRRTLLVEMEPKTEFLLHFGLAVFLLMYGFYEASHPRLERIEIADSRIPPGSRVRIALIADVHLGIMENLNRLERILALVRQANPDILVSAGDLIDVELDEQEILVGMLEKIQPPLGKFAVTGNHEAYANIGFSLDFLSRAGFKVLRGEAHEVTPFFTMVGFDDPVASRVVASAVRDVDVLAPISPRKMVVVVRHAPMIGSGTRDLFDLQLSGHTHGGQIWPYSFVIHFEYHALPGLTRLSDRSSLYLSRGSATFGPPVRVFAPPEVTVIDFVPASSSVRPSMAN